MKSATSATEVGVRELKNNLSRYLDRVERGEDVIVTDRGRPVARLVGIEPSTSNLSELVAAGLVVAPTSKARRRPATRIVPTAPVSDLVAEQRR